jgi:glycosyltransferase involved in cell wall biosynthesis
MKSHEPIFVWLGKYPSHYVRDFHCRLEKEEPNKWLFLYLESNVEMRRYECGELPSNSRIIKDNFFQTLTFLLDYKPKILILSGLLPRSNILIAIMAKLQSIDVGFYSDTNLINHIRSGILKRMSRSMLYGLLERFIFSWIFFIGTRNRDFHLTVGGQSIVGKLKFLPYPHDPDIFRQWKGSYGDRLNVLFLGRLVPVKAVDNIIEAVARIPPEKRALVDLIIAGTGTENLQLHLLASKYGIESNINFVGQVRSDDRVQFFKDADVFVLPSISEPWGLVVNEALSSGVPVIAPFWVGAVTDLVIHNYSGLVLNSNNPQEIANALIYAIDNKEKMKQMGANGACLVLEGGYCVKECIAAIRSICNNLEK